jgi:hypothetical protein
MNHPNEERDLGSQVRPTVRRMILVAEFQFHYRPNTLKKAQLQKARSGVKLSFLHNYDWTLAGKQKNHSFFTIKA